MMRLAELPLLCQLLLLLLRLHRGRYNWSIIFAFVPHGDDQKGDLSPQRRPRLVQEFSDGTGCRNLGVQDDGITEFQQAQTEKEAKDNGPSRPIPLKPGRIGVGHSFS